MADYEIRFLNADGGMSLFYAMSSASDDAAMDAVRAVQLHNAPDFESQSVEVWRDNDCIYRSHVSLASKPGEAGDRPRLFALSSILKALREAEAEMQGTGGAGNPANEPIQRSSAAGTSLQ